MVGTGKVRAEMTDAAEIAGDNVEADYEADAAEAAADSGALDMEQEGEVAPSLPSSFRALTRSKPPTSSAEPRPTPSSLNPCTQLMLSSLTQTTLVLPSLSLPPHSHLP